MDQSSVVQRKKRRLMSCFSGHWEKDVPLWHLMKHIELPKPIPSKILEFAETSRLFPRMSAHISASRSRIGIAAIECIARGGQQPQQDVFDAVREEYQAWHWSIFRKESDIMSYSDAAGAFLASCLSQLSIRDRRKILLCYIRREVLGMSDDAKEVCRSTLHALFCCFLYAAVGTAMRERHTVLSFRRCL